MNFPFSMNGSSWLYKNLRRGLVKQKIRVGRPHPEEKIAVIGDIHGRFDLLELLLVKIRLKEPIAKIVFVGDYIDRGADSRNVLNLLQHQFPLECCIMGNHEAMMLGFLDNPIENGARWLRHGGIETLESFGISISSDASASSVKAAQTALKKNFPMDWKLGYGLCLFSGDLEMLLLRMLAWIRANRSINRRIILFSGGTNGF